MVCFDEMPAQLVGETRTPSPAAPGRRARYDYEYARNGAANIYLRFEPKAGRRRVEAIERRAKVEFAAQIKALADEDYPEAGKIRVVLDQLDTHKPASPYEAYAPAAARRILRRLEFHHAPKHASRHNQAEIEFSVLSSPCLDRRVPDGEALEAELGAWEAERNAAEATVEWRITSERVRSKLHRLYSAQ